MRRHRARANFPHVLPRPNHVYYRACQGRWRCALALSITDAETLRSSGMSWTDRLSLRVLAAWPGWIGRCHLETSVSCADDVDAVVHTTVVRWLGVPLFWSTEVITLDPDGTTFSMQGEQRALPAVWLRRHLSGTGSIDETAEHASYAMVWLGVTLTQTTVREADRVVIHQRGPGFEGVQDLVRQPARNP